MDALASLENLTIGKMGFKLVYLNSNYWRKGSSTQ